MHELLLEAEVSSQWWNRLSRGLIDNPDPDLLARLRRVLRVSKKTLDAALAETRRWAALGEA